MFLITSSQDECLSALYIIQKGRVRIEFDVDVLENPNICSLKFEGQFPNDVMHSSKRLLLEKPEGSYFGEWALLGEEINQLRAFAVGDVTCSVLKKERFDSVVGPLTKISQDDRRYVVMQWA